MEKQLVIKAPKLPNLRPYSNKWIALSSDRLRVVSSGKSIADATRKIKPADRKKVAFLKVFPRGYSPTHA